MPPAPSCWNELGTIRSNGQYFAQKLLIEFMAKNPTTSATWDIAWDDRGHFTEPHTDHTIGLGTLAVRNYLNDVAGGVDLSLQLDGINYPTCGPHRRFQA